MKLTKLLCYILTIGLVLTGCKNKKKNDDLIVPAWDLYNSGLTFLEQQQYAKASEEFGKVFFQHPGNVITAQAELMQAYSLFLDSKYDEVIDVLEIFIKLHPMHSDIAYAYYLKSLSYYMQISNVPLDQSRTFLAKENLAYVIKQFPKTKYAIDASLKNDLVNDHLASKDMYIGRYYLKKNNPIAAISRFQLIIENYQTTSYAPESLYRLIESYLMLGLIEEAKQYASILGHNYPDSNWYQYGYRLIGAYAKESN